MAAHGCAIQRPTLLERRHGQSVAIVRALNRRRHRQRAGRLHRRRSAKPANAERATSSAAPTSTARCRFSGVGRRPHRCAGTPSSGSSADFPAASARHGGTCSGAWGRHRAGYPVGAARVAGDPATPATRRPARWLDTDDNALYRLGARPWSAASERFLSNAVSANPPCPCKQIGCSPAILPPDTRSEGCDAWRPRDSTFFLVHADGWRLAVIEVLLSNVGVPRTACIGTARVHCTARGVTEKRRQPAVHRRQHKPRVGCTCCTCCMNASAVTGTANRRTDEGQSVYRAR